MKRKINEIYTFLKKSKCKSKCSSKRKASKTVIVTHNTSKRNSKIQKERDNISSLENSKRNNGNSAKTKRIKSKNKIKTTSRNFNKIFELMNTSLNSIRGGRERDLFINECKKKHLPIVKLVLDKMEKNKISKINKVSKVNIKALISKKCRCRSAETSRYVHSKSSSKLIIDNVPDCQNVYLENCI